MAMVSSSDFLRAPERPTAISTLNRQRHLTPSCGGLTPTAERTVGPARISLESLTPRPGIREQYRHMLPRTCATAHPQLVRDPRCIRWSTDWNLACRIPHLDQRTALPDQSLHSLTKIIRTVTRRP